MSKTKYLIIAAIAGTFLLVGLSGGALVALPWIIASRTEVQVTETPELVTPLPTETPFVQITESPEATSPPTSEPTGLPTSELTSTVVPSATQTPAPTSVPVPCDWASFEYDITIPDGTDLVPGADFTKTWRIRNVGSCTWTSAYDLVFNSGEDFGASSVVPLPGTVSPGQTINLSVSMEAPDKEGAYTGYWMLRNADGKTFGIGDNRNQAFWVNIDVVLPCYWVGFVSDVTVPDNTSFSPGVSFVKTWRLKNIGDCAWTTDFDLVFSTGDRMGTSVVDMPKKVSPGETVDISVTFTAPADPDDYRGYWLIKSPGGTTFGMGDDQKSPFWVDIIVKDTDNDFVYDFAANFCSAIWKSGNGLLTCPGSGSDGYVKKIANPALENKNENEPALLMVPEDDADGWISGKYPAMVIQDGDHFKAWVGCMDGAEECEVTFYLNYQVDGGPVKMLGVWDEVYDGEVTVIDIDLSFLDGKLVTFTLVVEVDGGDPAQAEAFWLAPRIE